MRFSDKDLSWDEAVKSLTVEILKFLRDENIKCATAGFLNPKKQRTRGAFESAPVNRTVAIDDAVDTTSEDLVKEPSKKCRFNFAEKKMGPWSLEYTVEVASVTMNDTVSCGENENCFDYDRLLKTRFYVERAAFATLAALGIQASTLAHIPVETQRISISPVRAAAAIRQDRYIKFGADLPCLWQPLSGFYKCSDGRFIQLHCNFEHHARIALDVLGVDSSIKEAFDVAKLRSTVQSLVSKHKNVFALEQAFVDAGACASVVRTMDEWKQHPQFKAVSRLPLFSIDEIECTTKRTARVLGDNDTVLGGSLCLDLSRVVAGPIASRTLADFGSSVTRIVCPEIPYIKDLTLAFGHGKRVTQLSFSKPNELKVFKDLLQNADILINGFRPGCLDKYNLSTEEIARRYPGLVIVELSAFSHKGPWRNRRGFDSLVQCCTGIVHTHSEEIGSSTPVHLPCQALDYITGYLIAVGVTRALDLRQRQSIWKKSYIVRVSLCQTAIWLEKLGRKSDDCGWMNATNIPFEDIETALIKTQLSSRVPKEGYTMATLDLPIAMLEKPPKLGVHPDSFIPQNGSDLDKSETADASRIRKRKQITLPSFNTFKSSSSMKLEPCPCPENEMRHKLPIRNFAHVEGNWPTFFCIDVEVPSSILKAAKEFLNQHINANNNGEAAEEVFCIKDPHISLSRTFPVREHEISHLHDEARSKLSSFTVYDIRFSGLKLYYSENGSRIFAAAVVAKGKQKTVEIISVLDKLLACYAKDPYYEEREPHISLCWAPRRTDFSGQVSKAMTAPCTDSLPRLSCLQHNVSELVFRSGNRVHRIGLKNPSSDRAY